MRKNTKTYFELAEKERIAVKRGGKFVNLFVSNDPDEIYVSENWVRDFFKIPPEYRCNPFEISPSGDLFWADSRNIHQLEDVINTSESAVWTKLKKDEQKKFLGLE